MKDTIENGNRVYDPDEDKFLMPLKFSVAAFRFGHSTVRSEYNFNLNLNTTRPPASRATRPSISGATRFPASSGK